MEDVAIQDYAAEAGITAQNPLRVEMSTRAIAIYVDMASFVINELKQVGIEATLKQVETAQWHPMATRGEYQIGANRPHFDVVVELRQSGEARLADSAGASSIARKRRQAAALHIRTAIGADVDVVADFYFAGGDFGFGVEAEALAVNYEADVGAHFAVSPQVERFVYD